MVLTVVLFLSISFVPLAGFFSGMLTPSPVSTAFIRRGGRNGWAVSCCAAVAGCLVLCLLGLYYSIPYFLALIGMGVVMGHGIRNQWSTEKIIGYSSLLVIGMAALFAALAYIETGGEMVHLLEQDFREAISSTLKQLGVSSPEGIEVENSLLDSVPLIVRIMPGVLLSSAVVIAWLNLLISRRFCRAAAMETYVADRLVLWKAPEFLVWFVIAGGLMIIVPVPDLKMPGINVIIVMGTLYFLQGLAILAFFFERWNLPLFIKGFIYAMLFLQQFASMIVAALGLFDVWFDFRKLVNKPA